jgi:hypothetical protein
MDLSGTNETRNRENYIKSKLRGFYAFLRIVIGISRITHLEIVNTELLWITTGKAM